MMVYWVMVIYHYLVWGQYILAAIWAMLSTADTV